MEEGQAYPHLLPPCCLQFMKRSEVGPIEASNEEFRSHMHHLEERRSGLQEARIQLGDRLNRLAQHVLPPQVSGGALTDPALHGAQTGCLSCPALHMLPLPASAVDPWTMCLVCRSPACGQLQHSW